MDKGTAMIGIMADSHGQPETIAAALGVFTDMDCRLIYHLGDVCDSTHPETAEACLGPLRDPRVITIKFELTEKISCVVTCGALTRGFVMVWDPAENVIGCHSFR
jgi:hypothetical protein